MKFCENDLSSYPVLDEKYSFDFSNELSIDKFAVPNGFLKVADAFFFTPMNFPKSRGKFIDSIMFDKKLVDFKPIKEQSALYNNHKGIVYAIAFDGKIVKLGMSSVTLQKRLMSYNAGTRHNRSNGTCSTTNFHVIESIYCALHKNVAVELYVYAVNNPVVNISIWSDTVSIEIPEVSKFFEKSILQKYKEITGKYPWLSNNG